MSVVLPAPLERAARGQRERRLARAVGAKKAKRTTARHLEIDALERRARPKPLAESKRLYRESIRNDRWPRRGPLHGGVVGVTRHVLQFE